LARSAIVAATDLNGSVTIAPSRGVHHHHPAGRSRGDRGRPSGEVAALRADELASRIITNVVTDSLFSAELDF